MNRKEKRMCRLIICIRHFKKVLKESDFVAFNDDYGKEESIEKRGLVMLPTPGRRYGQKHAHRQCSRLCAVCLTQYESGDTIVWSSNSECQHVFHEKCIISWLMRKRNQLCPCCRQHFIDPKLDTSEVALYSELETDEWNFAPIYFILKWKRNDMISRWTVKFNPNHAFKTFHSRWACTMHIFVIGRRMCSSLTPISLLIGSPCQLIGWFLHIP